MKIYLAGPMTGIPDHNYPEFEKVAQDLRADGHEVASPHELFDEAPEERGSLPYEFYMRAGIKAMLECDAIALLPDWWKSRGAMAEFNAAIACNLTPYMWDKDYLGLVRL